MELIFMIIIDSYKWIVEYRSSEDDYLITDPAGNKDTSTRLRVINGDYFVIGHLNRADEHIHPSMSIGLLSRYFKDQFNDSFLAKKKPKTGIPNKRTKEQSSKPACKVLRYSGPRKYLSE